MTLRGADPATVRAAIDRRDPFPGTDGFAGVVDGELVRDVLGREPLFVERDAESSRPAADSWSFSPSDLEDPVPFPAGAVGTPTDHRRIWELPAAESSSGAVDESADPDGPDVDLAGALGPLRDALETAANSIERETDPANVAVAFSGGVDSALVAELLDAPLYVVGFPDSHDVAAARSAADALDRELTVVELEHADLERAVPTVARATGRTNAMDVGIALPLYFAAEAVAADGFDRLAVGQGADELFGGYEKVVRLDHRVDAGTVRGAILEQVRTLPEQLPRDVLTVRAAGVEPVAPLLHDAVVDAALGLPEELLADEDVRKRALRLVAAEYLPERIATREKKAVQYGSLVARELDRLARQAGYKRRMDDHVTRYVESLVERCAGSGSAGDPA